MRKLFLASFVVVAFGLILTACAPAEPTDTTNKPATKTADSELEDKIKAKFDSDPLLKSANLSVSADADKNEATISGVVGKESLRIKAVDLAKETSPGLILTDKIDVKPPELTGDELGDSLDDAWIHTKLVAKFIGDADTPGRKINVDVVNNVVTLRGTVDTAEQRAEAERIAGNTEGVKRVVNQLKVGTAAKSAK